MARPEITDKKHQQRCRISKGNLELTELISKWRSDGLSIEEMQSVLIRKLDWLTDCAMDID